MVSQSPDIDFDDPAFNWDAFIAAAINTPREVAIEAAWNAADPNTPAGRTARATIMTNAADDPEAQRILNDITGHQDRLEIRLNGAGVHEHSTSADKLGKFMKSMSAVLKDMAKATAGVDRIRDGILVTAPAPGSLIVTFDVQPTPQLEGAMPNTDADAIENAAMRQLASIFLQAEDQESDVLDATIHELRGKPRRSLKTVVKVIAEAGWEVEGDLIQRSGERAQIKLTHRASYRILDAVQESGQEVETIRTSGELDSWSWSRQTMRLILANGKAIEVSVPNEHASLVARYNAQRANVDVNLQRIATFPTGDTGSARYSYTLISIVLSPEQTSIDS